MDRKDTSGENGKDKEQRMNRDEQEMDTNGESRDEWKEQRQTENRE